MHNGGAYGEGTTESGAGIECGCLKLHASNTARTSFDLEFAHDFLPCDTPGITFPSVRDTYLIC